MRKSYYIPTGFPKGRPRKGEIRPLTPGGVWQAQYRAQQKRDNPQYLLQQALYQQLWRLANLERRREIARNSARRAKLWGNTQLRVSGKNI